MRAFCLRWCLRLFVWPVADLCEQAVSINLRKSSPIRLLACSPRSIESANVFIFLRRLHILNDFFAALASNSNVNNKPSYHNCLFSQPHINNVLLDRSLADKQKPILFSDVVLFIKTFFWEKIGYWVTQPCDLSRLAYHKCVLQFYLIETMWRQATLLVRPALYFITRHFALRSFRQNVKLVSRRIIVNRTLRISLFLE